MKKYSTEDFIVKARHIHGDKYSYELTDYTHSLEPISIICPIHGEFKIRPSNHINNRQGCKKCGKENHSKSVRKNGDLFIEEIKKKNGYENYEFSFVDFENKNQEIKVLCKKHGEYKATPKNILRSNCFCCSLCKLEAATHSQDSFEELARESHGDLYSYGEYKNSHTDIEVNCPEHGTYTCKPYIHIKGMAKCPECFKFRSVKESEIFDFIKSLNVEVEANYKKFDGVKEVDLVCHEFKLGIEFNGLFWHSEDKKKKYAHLNKTERLESFGYQLIHIFEDEWEEKKDICKSILLSKFNKCEKIHARLCKIKEISYQEAKNFLDINHIQGAVPGQVYLALAFEDEIVHVMVFGKSRICLGGNGYETELLRSCSKLNTRVLGGTCKTFSSYLKQSNDKKIISYCDRRWFDGNSYLKMGFLFEKNTDINYFYTKGNKRENRFKFRKSELIKMGFDKDKSEREIMKDLGYYRIWDCGCKKFTFSC